MRQALLARLIPRASFSADCIRLTRTAQVSRVCPLRLSSSVIVGSGPVRHHSRKPALPRQARRRVVPLLIQADHLRRFRRGTESARRSSVSTCRKSAVTCSAIRNARWIEGQQWVQFARLPGVRWTQSPWRDVGLVDLLVSKSLRFTNRQCSALQRLAQ